MLAARVIHALDGTSPDGAVQAAIRVVEKIGGEAGSISKRAGLSICRSPSNTTARLDHPSLSLRLCDIILDPCGNKAQTVLLGAFHARRRQCFLRTANSSIRYGRETPDPLFARALQQAIGGVEGEIRVAMQYFFQACGARGNTKFRDLLMNTAAEELGHIEMLATAVALNLEGAPLSIREEVAGDPVGGAVLGGINLKNLLSSGLAAMPVDSDGVPFDMSHIYASGNIAADMTANVTAEATGRVLAVRLYGMTNDPGMKDMLSFLIARDYDASESVARGS
ncbi:putative manganese catalase [Ensifer psoraleae]|nr:putative manganese catalase [Sinorhizobium psoraleae]